MHSEDVKRIRNAVSTEIQMCRRETKSEYLNSRRKDFYCRSLVGKIPTLDGFQIICTTFVTGKRGDDLGQISHALSLGRKYIDICMKTAGIFETLRIFLTGTNWKYQMEATQLVINLACAPAEECLIISKEIGLFIITNMFSENLEYQHLSSWAMGNLCCQSVEACERAKLQGMEEMLLCLLVKQEVTVLRSACFALDNYMRALPSSILSICESKCTVLLKNFNEMDEFLPEIAWCLFVFSTSSDSCKILASHNIVEVMMNCLTHMYTESEMELSLTTACIRILINCIAETIDVSLKIVLHLQRFALICDYIKDFSCYYIRKELLQCISNLFNRIRLHKESILETCKFDFYMKPVIQYLESTAVVKKEE